MNGFRIISEPDRYTKEADRKRRWRSEHPEYLEQDRQRRKRARELEVHRRIVARILSIPAKDPE